MKKINNLKLFAFGILIFVIFPSCSKNDSGNNNGPPQPCDFPTNSVVTSSDVPVTYNASNSNNASVTSLIYQGAAGPVIVTNPKLPWTITVSIPEGDTVYIFGCGVVSGGSLSLSYLIHYSNPNSNSVLCGN